METKTKKETVHTSLNVTQHVIGNRLTENEF